MWQILNAIRNKNKRIVIKGFCFSKVVIITVIAAALILGSQGTAAAGEGLDWLNPLPQGNNLNDVTFKSFLGDMFVAVGNQGTIVTSPDGINWTIRDSGTNHHLWSVTYSMPPDPDECMFVAVGSNGTIVTSRDGITWTKRESGTTQGLYGITYGGYSYIAVGGYAGQSTILTSWDGIEWTALEDPGINAGLTGIDHGFVPGGNSMYVTVGTNNTIATSINRTTWVERDPSSSKPNRFNNISSGTLGNNFQYIAVGTNGLVRASQDGIDWYVRKTEATSDLHGVIIREDQIVVVGKSRAIYTSSDGLEWIFRPSATTRDLYGITYGNNLYVVVGQDGTILTSPTGVEWTIRHISVTENNLNRVIFDNNRYVAVGDNGTILSSEDGDIWNKRDSKTVYHLQDVAFGNGMYVAVGENGTVLTSVSGSGWTLRSSGIASHLNGVTYGDGHFIAVGHHGRIIISEDGINWEQLDFIAPSHLRSIAYYQNTHFNHYVAVGDAGVMIYSQHGLSLWHVVQTPHTQYFNRITCIPGTSFFDFVAVASMGIIHKAFYNIVPSGTYAALNGIAWNEETHAGRRSIVVGNNGVMLTSQDAQVWYTLNSGTTENFNDVAKGPDRYVVVGDNGFIFRSPLLLRILIVRSYFDGIQNDGVPISSNTGHDGTTGYAKMFQNGTSVTLTAPVIPNLEFSGWSGNFQGDLMNRTITFNVPADMLINANYITTSEPVIENHLYASFTDAVYAFDGNDWIASPVAHAPSLSLAPHGGNLYGAFADGIYVYDRTSWDINKITPGVASNMASYNGKLYGSFADATYVYDGNQWTLFTWLTNALAAY